MEQLPGPLGDDHLPPFPQLYHTEDMLAPGGRREAVLRKVEQVVQGDPVQRGQRVAVEDIRGGLAGFPLRQGLPGHPYGLRRLLLGEPFRLPQAGEVVRQIALFHTFLPFPT